MKKLTLTLVLILLTTFVTYSQNKQYKVDSLSNELVRVISKIKTPDTKTKYTVTIKKVIYPVYKSKKNKYYIIRTAKKSGKTRREYIDIE